MNLEKSKWILYPLSKARKLMSKTGVPEEILAACEIAAKQNPELLGVAVDLDLSGNVRVGAITQSFVTVGDVIKSLRPYPEFEKYREHLLGIINGKYDCFDWQFDHTDVELYDILYHAVPRNPETDNKAHVANVFNIIWSIRFNNPIGDLSKMFVTEESSYLSNHQFETGDMVRVSLIGDQEVYGVVAGFIEKNKRAYLNIVTVETILLNNNKEQMWLNCGDKFPAPIGSVEKYISQQAQAV